MASGRVQASPERGRPPKQPWRVTTLARSFIRSARRTMRRASDITGFVLFALAILLTGLAGWIAVKSAVSSGWSSDAAAWTQAAGSIAAIAGAAWLAQSEARRSRKLRRAHHEEAAWYVRFAVQQAQFESHIIAAELVNRTTPVTKADIRNWRQRAMTSALSLGALVSKIEHIHPAVTQVISNAKILIDDLVDDLKLAAIAVDSGGQPDDDLKGHLVGPHRALLDLLELYDARMRGVRDVLDDENDALPIRSWAGWKARDSAGG